MPRTSAQTAQRTQAAAITDTAARYYARRPFTYGGLELARGELFTLIGSPNDEKLIRLNYIAVVDSTLHETYRCAECGKVFMQMGFRDMHGKESHKPPLSFENEGARIRWEDTQADIREKQLAKEAPLALEKTLAAIS